MVSLDFSVTYYFRLHHGPGVDSAPSENEYQEHFLGVKAAGPYHLHVPSDLKIRQPKPPGNLWVTQGLLRDCFTFYILIRNTVTNFASRLINGLHYTIL
jgi:hypothetical protein